MAAPHRLARHLFPATVIIIVKIVTPEMFIINVMIAKKNCRISSYDLISTTVLVDMREN